MSDAVQPVLEISDLSLEFTAAQGGVRALDEVTLQVRPAEIVGLVGESGSGKSVTALCVMQLLAARSHSVTGGRIVLLGRDVLGAGGAQLARMRGAEAAMIFQEPMTSLNPVKRIVELMIEVIRRHRRVSRRAARSIAAELLADAQLSDVERVLRSYPFELSGGMRQRVLIAMAFSCRPKLLIADEPTTALDVTVQAQILDLVREMARKHATAVLFITHDLGVVRQLCSRMYVMQRGRIVESGETGAVLSNPAHAYTRSLLGALPELAEPMQFIATGDEAPTPSLQTADRRTGQVLLEVKNLTVCFDADRGRGKRTVVRDVSFEVREGETVSIIGESGCGKSTLARTVVGLIRPERGSVAYRPSAPTSQDAAGALRREVQMVFQDPRSSLNPRMRVWEIITEPLAVAERLGRAQLREHAQRLAAQVGLTPDQLHRYPDAFSGGQRQRIAIARALSTSPRLLVLDEPTSALDVSIQARILNLLLKLQYELGLSYLFISHDVPVVRHISHRVLVMQSGALVEQGEARQVLEHPRHPYTRQLMEAVPRVTSGRGRLGVHEEQIA
ncbi:MAG TPA: ABC transporter ATP-binding protein [Steroidobacter sp.]|uniref:ABC transporter ATP-binding protein n=1 Tax=Steroidobacter sp. TaxID=1978227 RepID=UPI002ED7F699